MHPSAHRLFGPVSTPALLVALLAGCRQDTEVKQVDTDPYGASYVPQIEVTPDELVFPEADLGTAEELTFVVENVGDADLHVSSVTIQGSSAFTLMTPGDPFVLSPTQSIQYIVSYSPLAPEERAQIHIASDDVGNPDALVDVEGTGRFPQLLIEPDPLDFGAVLVGCTRTIPLTLRNVGHGPLHIATIAQIGDSFTAALPTLPLTLEAGGTTSLDLTFAATSEDYAESELVVQSDDAVSTQTATQSAHGSLDGVVQDDFWQGDGPWDKTDLLFYVDQSCSMVDDQRNLSANFSSFVNRLSDLNLDWQIMVSTKDNGCHNGTIMTPETPSAGEEFLDDVGGRGGQYTEAGLTVALHAMQETGVGGCNEGFLREDSKTMLVLISDEVEQSPGSGSVWQSITDNIVSIAPTTSITAIAGDIPSGCPHAEPGYGYYEASRWTSGAFLSICSPDFASYFETIADMSATGQIDTFYLSSSPDPVTLVVTVDDVVASSDLWSYDETLNAVVFASGQMPGPGSHILVDYQLGSDCDG